MVVLNFVPNCKRHKHTILKYFLFYTRNLCKLYPKVYTETDINLRNKQNCSHYLAENIFARMKSKLLRTFFSSVIFVYFIDTRIHSNSLIFTHIH